MNKENKKIKKKTTLFGQLQSAMIPYFIILMIALSFISLAFMGYAIVRQTMENAIEESDNAVREVKKYKSYGALFDYWVEKSSELELKYDESYLSEKEAFLRAIYPDLSSITEVTGEEFKSMSPDEKKLFSEICYGRMSNDLSRIKRSYKPLYLYTCTVKDGTLYFLATGAYEGEKRISEGGDLYELGFSIPYTFGMWNSMDRILSGDEDEIKKSSHIENDYRRRQVGEINPIYDGDRLVGFLGVSESYQGLVISAVRASVGLIIILLLSFILLEIRLMQIIKKIAAAPLDEEEKAIKEYRENKDSERVKEVLSRIDSQNEIQSLAESFSKMVTEIDTHIEHIKKMTTERERLSAELDVATKIQASMLPGKFPPFPDRNEFIIYASMEPAKEVGGDFYDFFFVDKDHIALVIGDVSGKGVPAALFMALSKSSIKNRAVLGDALSRVIGDVNDSLTEGNDEGMFVTVWMAVIDLRNGHGISVNAGHEHPFLFKAGGEYEEKIYEHDLFLGAMKTSDPYEEREFFLSPGDRIFVYTDGASEAKNNNEELFGEDRIKAALNKETAAEPEKVISNVSDAIKEFTKGAEQFDDITMLSFYYKGDKA